MDATSERRKPGSTARAGSSSGRHKRWNCTRPKSNSDLAHELFVILSVAALAYALLAGLRSVRLHNLGVSNPFLHSRYAGRHVSHSAAQARLCAWRRNSSCASRG